MTVKDLIKKVPVDEFLEEYKTREEPVNEDMEKSRIFFIHFFDNLLKKTPVESGFVILGTNYLDSFEDGEIFETSAYDKADLEKFKRIPVIDNTDKAAIRGVSLDIKEKIMHRYRLPESYAYDFTPWDEILGMEVDENNLAEFSPAKVLSDIIYEMTFTGYEEEEVQEQLDKIKQSIDEVEEILKLPEEEQSKHFITADELFSELGYTDERTEEEKKATHEKAMRDMFENWLRKYYMLVKYISKND